MDLVVLHSTENDRTRGSARRVGRYFATTEREVSAHYIVDNEEIVQCVSERNVAWAAPGANDRGIQVELVGRAKHTAEQWREGGFLDGAAELVAAICKRWSIPVELLTSAELRTGTRLVRFAGTVTPALTSWAQETLRSGAPIGTIVHRGAVAARVEEHTWTWRDGVIVYGKFRGVSLYDVVPAKRGITTHASVSQAFRKSSHWDPGLGFPMAEFLNSVARLLT